jgi:hypothetical protein
MSREQNETRRSECTHVWMICTYMQDLPHQEGGKIATSGNRNLTARHWHKRWSSAIYLIPMRPRMSWHNMTAWPAAEDASGP